MSKWQKEELFLASSADFSWKESVSHQQAGFEVKADANINNCKICHVVMSEGEAGESLNEEVCLREGGTNRASLSDVEKVNPCRPQWRNAVWCCCSLCDNINVDTLKAYVLMIVCVCVCQKQVCSCLIVRFSSLECSRQWRMQLSPYLVGPIVCLFTLEDKQAAGGSLCPTYHAHFQCLLEI